MAGIDNDLTEKVSHIISLLNCARVGPNVNGGSLQNQYQIEALKLRLSRWWRVITQLGDAHHPIIDTLNSDESVKNALESLEGLLRNQEMATSPVKSPKTVDDWMLNSLQRLSLRHHGLILPADQPNWIIGENMDFEYLKAKTTTVLDRLEIADLEKNLDSLRSQDAIYIKNQAQGNQGGIATLKWKISEVDEKFSQFLKDGSGHLYKDSTAKDKAKIINGDSYASDYSGRSIQSTHTYSGTVALGEARVVQGNMYGFNPFGQGTDSMRW